MRFLYLLLLIILSHSASAGGPLVLIPKSNQQPGIALYTPSQRDSVPQHTKFEIGLALPDNLQREIQNFLVNSNGGLNPYDPEAISIEVLFRSAGGRYKTRYGFYYQPFRMEQNGDFWMPDSTSYPWRVRFAPDQTGDWAADIRVLRNGLPLYAQQTIYFRCVAGTHKGRLQNPRVYDRPNRILAFPDGSPFTIIGDNISSGGFVTYKPSQQQHQLNGVKELKRSGGTFTRFELPAQAGLPDWPVYDNYTGKLDEMYGFDEIVEYCTQEEIYFTVFRHHVELFEDPDHIGEASWEGVSWFENPYRKAFGMERQIAYFTDTNALVWQKNCLRYMDARWGYSPKFAFFGFSEINNWYRTMQRQEGFSENQALDTMYAWYSRLQDYMKDELHVGFMATNSYASLPQAELNGADRFLAASDLISIHVYEETKSVNAIKRYNAVNLLFEQYQRPVLLEEAGINGDHLKIYCCTGIDFHNEIWSSTLSGSAGTALDWWWNRGVHDFGYIRDLQSVRNFTERFDLHNAHFTPQRWIDRSRNPIDLLAGRDLLYRAAIENFALQNDSGTLILGWVHNAAYYWRNLETQCMQSLLDSSTLSTACMVEQNYDLNREQNKSFQGARYTDAYSDTQQNIDLPKSNGTTFEISNVQRRVDGRKCRYRITFYHVQNGEFREAPEETQVLEANFFGKLKPRLPTLDANDPDYAYVIERIE